MGFQANHSNILIREQGWRGQGGKDSSSNNQSPFQWGTNSATNSHQHCLLSRKYEIHWRLGACQESLTFYLKKRWECKIILITSVEIDFLSLTSSSTTINGRRRFRKTTMKSFSDNSINTSFSLWLFIPPSNIYVERLIHHLRRLKSNIYLIQTSATKSSASGFPIWFSEVRLTGFPGHLVSEIHAPRHAREEQRDHSPVSFRCYDGTNCLANSSPSCKNWT